MRKRVASLPPLRRGAGWRAAGAGTVGALALAAGVAAAEAPTLQADPEVVGLGARLVLQGTIPSRRAGDDVEIEFRECRGTFFRVYAATKTDAGGVFRYQVPGVEANTHFRVRANGATSAPVYVRRRAAVLLDVKGRGRFIGRVFSPFVNLTDRRIRLERFSARGWVLIRTAKLRRVAGPQYEARFLVRTRGLQLRATVGEATVRPCYVAGVSPIARS